MPSGNSVVTCRHHLCNCSLICIFVHAKRLFRKWRFLGSGLEIYGKLQEIIQRDYNTFSGLMLERYFHRRAMESGEFTRIGRWWNRKGENEIDMICEDELAERAIFYEIKRQKDEISIGVLKQKSEAMLRATGAFKGYEIGYEGLSMEEM